MRHWPTIATVALTIVLAMILDDFHRRLSLEKERNLTIYELERAHAYIEEQVDESLKAGTRLSDWLNRTGYVGESTFRSLALQASNATLQACCISWAPDFVETVQINRNTDVATVGSDLRETSPLGPDLERVLIEQGVVTEISSQESSGFSGLQFRFAVKGPEAPSGRLTGVVSIGLSFEDLLKASGILDVDPPIHVTIRAQGIAGGPEQIFLAGGMRHRSEEPVSTTFAIPGGKLTLFAEPVDGWKLSRGSDLVIRLGLFLLCILIAGLSIWGNSVAFKRDEATQARNSAEDRLVGVLTNFPGSALIYTMPPGASIPSSEDRIDFLNKETCWKIWGVDASIVESDVTRIWSVDDDGEKVKNFRGEVAEATRRFRPLHFVWPIKTPQGEKKWLECRGHPTRLDDGAVRWIAMVVDVTEQVERDEELQKQREITQRSQKQESIGQLTGGVAHDFNNLLAVIMGNLELLRDEVSDKQLLELIDSSIKASRRGADLTKNMLSFARKAKLEPSSLNLNNLVSETRNWAGRTLPSTIEIETSLLAGLWPIEADAASTESALLNLIVNARDAMPKGGKLTIETQNVRIDREYIVSHEEEIPPGRYVLLAVSDTGIGIPESKRSKVFEPFYSDKPPGAGSGLGLSMVDGFIRQTGGTVQIYSEPGQGTTFKLYFPALEKSENRTVPSSTVSDPEKTETGRILVAEDEDEVRSVLVKTLERAGYEVVEARTGDEAFAIFGRSPEFDLVVTDIVMPGRLQGTGLSREIRQLREDTPIIFMSGYASEATVHGNGLHPDDIRLMKPVLRAEFLEAVKKVISGSRRTA